MRYIPNTDADRKAMLQAIGRSSVEELFSDIPQAVRASFRPLDLPARSELEVVETVAGLARANRFGDYVSFLGGGVYDHYVPSVVGHVASRSEFYTAYTPYQPEVSQGTLTAMFEFQTMIAELFGMEIANASMYDGATALAEAVLMADRVARKGKVAVSRALFPHLRRVVSTYAWAAGITLVEVPCGADGRTDLAALPQGVAALVLQTPNAFGAIEDLSGVKERLGEALLVLSANPIACALLEPPGAFGADIVVGEGQPLGLSPSFGGPLLGLFASREAYLRQMPGRLVSRTVDAAGQTGYVLAAQTREQHIRREKATSNICTNAALCALSATVYMASLGAQGLRDLALLNWERAHDLATKIAAFPGYSLAFKAPFFNEVTVRVPGDAERTRLRLKEAGFLVGSSKPLAALGVPNALRFAVTEKRTREEIDRLVSALGGAR